MKHIKQALICFSALALVFFGCKKEYSYEVPGGGGVGGSYQWSFTEGTNSFKGPMDTAYLDTLGTLHQLNITGRSSDNKDIISLQIFADTIQVGSYQTDRCSFDYLRSGVALYRSDLTAIGQFTVSITAMDSISITGTFSGTALDTGKVKKTITDGKFKVKFKSHTTPPPTNCTISKILYTDIPSNSNYYTQFSLFNGNNVSTISLSDSSAQLFSVSFPVTLAIGKTNVPVNGKPQYFTNDINGRATAFYGFEDPLTDTSAAFVAKYTYDAGGHMTRRTEAAAAKPDSVVFDMTYTWSGNLLTKAVVKYGGQTALQVDYTYDAGKTVKNFLPLHPYAAEVFYFQSAVNVGVRPDKALTKVTEQWFSPSGTSTFTSNLGSYVIDANNYVKSFTVTGDDFTAMSLVSDIGLFATTKYTLSYHCQ